MMTHTATPEQIAAFQTLCAMAARRASYPKLVASIVDTPLPRNVFDEPKALRARVYLDGSHGPVVAERTFPVNPFDRFQRDAHQAACRWAYSHGARRVDGPVSFLLTEDRDGDCV